MGVQAPIPIQLDKLRHIKLDLRALALAEREIARFWERKERLSIVQIFQGGDVGIADLCILLWAGLRHEDPALTVDQAFTLASGVSMQVVSEAMGQALREQLGTGAASEAASQEDPPQPTTAATPSASIGANSGPSGSSISG
jgi:hypothetical protein